MRRPFVLPVRSRGADQAARGFARGARAVGGALHSYDQNVGLGSSRVPREITIPTGSIFAFRC